MATVIQPVELHFRNRPARGTVSEVAGLATITHGVDEGALAQRAAAGDGDAFATLYERYESRVVNLCFRILGSQDDAADAAQEAFVNVLRRLPKLEGRELAFGSYVFTSARNACYDLIERRRRTEPSDEIPEHATPVGGAVGGGGVGLDPGDPEDDPERNVLLEARTDEIREANLTLPERQREALALKELEDLSYEEIAEIMGMNRNSVAQLISRARIGLRGALRGSALASIAPSGPDCERAGPLLSALQDGQLRGDSPDAEWLGDHLVTCDSCPLRRDAMEEAGVSYRAWLPIAAGPLLFRETMAEAAEVVGADWSDVIDRRESARAASGPAAGAGGAGTEGARASILRHRRLDLALMALLGLALVLVVFVGPTGDDSPIEAVMPAADEAPPAAEETQSGKPSGKPDKGQKDKDEAGKPGGENGSPAAAPARGEAQDQAAAEPGPGAGTSAGTDARDRQRQPSGGGDVDRDGDGAAGDDRVAADPAPEPPPPAEVTPEQPPPPPPETETTPTRPPVCRDPATGTPIPCGTQPPRRPPTSPPPVRVP
jgi:RNA polymerase sigma-70 factor, ECF subfamily